MSKTTPLADISEAEKAQEWANRNSTHETVKSVMEDVKKKLFGTLNLPEKGDLEAGHQQSVKAKIAEDKFAADWIKKALNDKHSIDYDTTSNSADIKKALDMLVEIRAYLGFVTRLGNQMDENRKACTEIKTVAQTGDATKIPPSFKGNFDHWKQSLQDKSKKIESNYEILRDHEGKRIENKQLEKKYKNWKAREDISTLSLTSSNDAQKNKEAEDAVVKAKTTENTTDIGDAETKVAAMPDATRQVALQRELQDLKDKIDAAKKNKEAEDAVTNAKASKDAGDIADAKSKIVAMPDRTRATTLETEITDLEKNIANEKLNKDAEDAVIKAKTTENTTDIGDAEAKVIAMPDTTRQAVLQKELQDLKDKIDATKKNKEAEDAVIKAKTTENTTDIGDAETKVAAMPDATRQVALQRELQDLKDKIDKKNLIKDLNTTPNLDKDKIKQGTNAPEFTIQNAIDDEEITVSYRDRKTNRTTSVTATASGGKCKFKLPNFDTEEVGTENIHIVREKDGVTSKRHTLGIDIFEKEKQPEKPEDLTDDIVLKGNNTTQVSGKLKDPKDGGVVVLDKNKRPVSGISITPNTTTGEFDFDIKASDVGLEYNGTERFYIKITGATGTTPCIVPIKATVSGKKEKIDDIPKPDFDLPNGPFEQEKECFFPIKLKNAVKGSLVDIEIEKKGGGSSTSVTKKDNISIRNNGQLTLSSLGKIKFIEDGTHIIRVTYKNDDGSLHETEEQEFDVNKKPDKTPPSIPEDIPNIIDITSEPYKLAGKLTDPSHTVEITEGTTIIGKPKIDKDGKFGQLIPPFGDDEYEKTITMKISNGTDEYIHAVKIRKNIKPAKQEIITGYDLGHITEEVEKRGIPQAYRIKGHGTTDFLIGKMKKKEKGDWVKHNRWYAQVPDDHGHFSPAPLAGTPSDNLVYANTKEELIKKINEKLHHINHHAELGYNSVFGISTPHSAEGHGHGEKHDEKHGEKHDEKGHKPEDKKENKEGEKHDEHKKDEHHGDHGSHGHDKDHGDETLYDKAVSKIFGNGLIGKMLMGGKKIIPKPIRFIAGNGIGGAVTSGVTGGILYGTSVALGSAAFASAIVPAMGITFTGAMINRLILKPLKWWPHNKKEGGGQDHGHGGGHAH